MGIIFFIVLLFLSAFFSSSEVALLSISKARVRNFADEGIKGSKSLKKLKDDIEKTLITILIGNNLANVAASALATSMAIRAFGDVGVGIATGVVVLLLLIFGEITPKSFATKNKEKLALLFSRPLYALYVFLTPLTIFFSFISRGMFEMTTLEEDSSLTEEELKEWINVGEEDGAIERAEEEIMYNVLRFGDATAKDVMKPIEEMVSADVNSSVEEILELMVESGYSRIPIYKGDDVVGVIHAKDLLLSPSKNNENYKNGSLEEMIREPYFAFETRRISELLGKLRGGTHIAIVIDESGKVTGLLTTEDIVEEIVGEIQDEFDRE
jgi:CBS domain containing-hemolysin-like protein